MTANPDPAGLEEANDLANVPNSEEKQQPPGGPPDGGLQAWLTVLGGFCVLFVSFGWINCMGVFQDYYQTHQLQNYSATTVAWIPSVETMMMFLGGPVFGKLFDSYGPRWIVLGGTFFCVFGLMMASISSEYYQFLLTQGICSPLGACALFFASTASVATWFQRRRGLAFGLMASGSSLGGVLYPIMVTHLVGEVGYGWTMRICAFTILFMLVIANFTVRSRLQHHPKKVIFLDFVRPLKEIPFLLTVTGAFFFFWGMFLPFDFIILESQRYGMSARLSVYTVSILNAASIIGRTLSGYVADHLGRFNIMVVTTFFSSILVLAMWLPSKSNAPILAFCALYGFGSGAFISLAPAIIAQISEVQQIGTRTGTFFAIVSVAALTGSPIGGALVPDVVTGSFWKLQLFAGVVMLFGSSVFLAVRIYIGGANPWKKV